MWPFKTGCDCLRKKDQNIVAAETITEEQAFVSCMEINNINFELREGSFFDLNRAYVFNILRDKNYEVHYYPSANALFEKRACLTCKKCMGWYVSQQGYWDDISNNPLASKSLENGFNIYINNQIEQLKLEENVKKIGRQRQTGCEKKGKKQ